MIDGDFIGSLIVLDPISQANRFHNYAVLDYEATLCGRFRPGVQEDSRAHERAVLGLAHGLHQYVALSGVKGEDQGPDYYGKNLMEHLLDGFTDALNLDLGRLSGSRLSEWALELWPYVDSA